VTRHQNASWQCIMPHCISSVNMLHVQCFCIKAILFRIYPTLRCLYLHVGGAYGAQRRSCHLLTRAHLNMECHKPSWAAVVTSHQNASWQCLMLHCITSMIIFADAGCYKCIFASNMKLQTHTHRDMTQHQKSTCLLDAASLPVYNFVLATSANTSMIRSTRVPGSDMRTKTRRRSEASLEVLCIYIYICL
jgi:hypothetical protein